MFTKELLITGLILALSTISDCRQTQTFEDFLSVLNAFKNSTNQRLPKFKNFHIAIRHKTRLSVLLLKSLGVWKSMLDARRSLSRLFQRFFSARTACTFVAEKLFLPHCQNKDMQCLIEQTNFHPCENRPDRYFQSFKHLLARNICVPKPAHMVLPGVKESNFVVTEHKSFYLNLSFPEFNFANHQLCKTDFLNIEHPLHRSKKVWSPTSEHIFCGRRHPWTMLYPSHKAYFWMQASSGSSLKLNYQIFSSFLLVAFDSCSSAVCGANMCISPHCACYESPSIPHGGQTCCLSSTISFFNSQGNETHLQTLNIFQVYVAKYQFVQVFCHFHCWIFDGPSVLSKNVTHRVKKEKLLMSSFQATIIAFKIKYASYVGILRHRHPISASQKKKQSFVSFKTNCQFDDCIIFETKWIKQPKEHSFNVCVEHMHYAGPEEPTDFGRYGGIAIYQIHKNNLAGEELLVVTHTIQNEKWFDKRSHHPVVTGQHTTHLVLVYYYYARYSFVTATVSVQKTDCAGKYVPLHFCGDDFELKIISSSVYTYLLGLWSGFGYVFFPLRTQTMCGTIVVSRDVKAGYSLHRLVGSCGPQHKQGTILIMNYILDDLPTRPREIQFEVHMLKYVLFLKGEFVLVENVLNTSQHFNVSPAWGTKPHSYKNRCSNSQFCVPLEYCEDSAFYIKSNNSHVHDKVATLSMLYEVERDVDVCMIPHENNYKPGWITIKFNLLSCKMSHSNFTLFPAILTQAAFYLQCKVKTIKLITDIKLENMFKESNVLLHTIKHSQLVQNSPLLQLVRGGGKVVILSETASLKQQMQILKQNHEIAKIKLQIITNLTQKGNLILRWSGSILGYRLSLIKGHMNIILPTILSPEQKPNDRFHCLDISVSVNLLPQLYKIQMLPVNNFSSVFKTGLSPKLHAFSNNTNEKHQDVFVSWNDASQTCKSKGMNLPSVHSTFDVDAFKQQINQFEELRLHQTFQKEGIFGTFYHILALYIGLNTKVRFTEGDSAV